MSLFRNVRMYASRCVAASSLLRHVYMLLSSIQVRRVADSVIHEEFEVHSREQITQRRRILLEQFRRSELSYLVWSYLNYVTREVMLIAIFATLLDFTQLHPFHPASPDSPDYSWMRWMSWDVPSHNNHVCITICDLITC